jgi:hypothetical protein
MRDDLLPSDHKFSQFLARMTPQKVFKDRSAMFSKPEKQIDRFFRQGDAIARADEMEIELQVWRRVA